MSPIADKIKIKDKMRNFSWVSHQKSKDRLYIDDKKITDKVFEELKTFIHFTQEIYENSWDIDIEVKYILTDSDEEKRKLIINIIGIVLHFPQITIKNRDKKSHLIKDLFVRIPLSIHKDAFETLESIEKLRIGGIIQGCRTTVSFNEYCSSYLHSHLKRRNFMSRPIYSTFCTGSGDINTYHMNINSDGVKESNVIPYLIQIMTLISYESLEGNPYVKLQYIMPRGSSSINNQMDNAYGISINLLDDILDYHKKNNLIPCLEFSIENDKYVIKDNNKFDRFLMTNDYVINKDTDLLNTFLCTKDEAGFYYPYNYVPEKIEIPVAKHKYIFQGKEIEFIVENIPKEMDLNNVEYFINPIIKNTIKNKIENAINKKIIRESTINRYSNKSNNT